MARSFSMIAIAVILPFAGGESGACGDTPLEPGSYRVEVHNEHTRGGSWVGDCHPIGSRLTWRDDRRGEAKPLDPASVTAPCEVRAYETRGAFRVRSAAVRVEPITDGEVHPIRLFLPRRASGGIGFQFDIERQGARVIRVFQQTPPDLHLGDLIVAVDGMPTAGATAWEFLDRSVGPAGTPVQLTVLRDGVRRTAWFGRRAMRPADFQHDRAPSPPHDRL